MLKQVFIILLCTILLTSCKQDKKDNKQPEENATKSYNQNDGLVTLRGEFIYIADAAVLQTSQDIYGVVIDQNMHKLNEQVKPFKKEDTDMVPVTVRVKKFPKPKNEEGWAFRVEIKEILKVEAPDAAKNDVIKLEK